MSPNESPLKYWSLISTVLTSMTDFFGCRIILMTATKPLIFSDEDKYKELVSDYRKYFQSSKLNRVVLKYSEPMSLSEFIDSLPEFQLTSYLFVFNTINSSIQFYEKILDVEGYKKIYLSTGIIPKEREKRIDEIKAILKRNKESDIKEKFIVISTQLIEAGVDIDCDCAYRDLGPLDSIIQVAGRCNRNNLSDKNGDVNITKLHNDNNYDFCKIYDPTLNDISQRILQEKKIIPESEFIQIIEEYFKEAKQKMYSDSHLIKSVTSLCFDGVDKANPVSSFKLIDDDERDTVSVSVVQAELLRLCGGAR